jgi:WD40 repeat protein
MATAPLQGTVVLASEDHTVKQWNLEGGIPTAATVEEEPTYGVPFSDDAGEVVLSLAFSKDGSWLAGADRRGRAQLWQSTDDAPFKTIPVTDLGVTALSISEDKEQLVLAGEKGPNMYVVHTAFAHVEGPFETVLWQGAATEYVPGGEFLVTAGHWYSVPALELRRVAAPLVPVDSWVGDGYTGVLRDLAVTPDRQNLVVAGDNFVAVLKLADLKAGPFAVAVVPGHEAVGVAVTPGGEFFVTAGKEGTLRLWETATAKEVAMTPIPAAVGLGMDEAGARIFTSGPDGLLHAFTCKEGQP